MVTFKLKNTNQTIRTDCIMAEVDYRTYDQALRCVVLQVADYFAKEGSIRPRNDLQKIMMEYQTLKWLTEMEVHFEHITVLPFKYFDLKELPFLDDDGIRYAKFESIKLFTYNGEGTRFEIEIQ